MKTEYEKVLTIRNKDNKLMGFWCHDMQSHTVELYLCEKASIDEIKDLVETLKINNNLVENKVHFRVLPHDSTTDLKKDDLYELTLTEDVNHDAKVSRKANLKVLPDSVLDTVNFRNKK